MYTENKQKQHLHKMAENDRSSNPTTIVRTCFIALCLVMLIKQLDTRGNKYASSPINQQSSNHTDDNRKNDRLLAILMNRQDLKPENGVNIVQKRRKYQPSRSSSMKSNKKITYLQIQRKNHKKKDRKSVHKLNLKLHIISALIKMAKVVHLNGELHSSKTDNKSTNNEFPSKWNIGPRLNIMHIPSNQKQVSQKSHRKKDKNLQPNSNFSQHQYNQINLEDFFMLKLSSRNILRAHFQDDRNSTFTPIHLAKHTRLILIQRYPAFVLNLILCIRKITKCWSPYFMIQIIIHHQRFVNRPVINNVCNKIQQPGCNKEHDQFLMFKKFRNMQELLRTFHERVKAPLDFFFLCKCRRSNGRKSASITPSKRNIIQFKSRYIPYLNHVLITKNENQNDSKKKNMRRSQSLVSFTHSMEDIKSVQRHHYNEIKITHQFLRFPANYKDLKILFPIGKSKSRQIIGPSKKFDDNVQSNTNKVMVKDKWNIILKIQVLDRTLTKKQCIHNDPKWIESFHKKFMFKYGKKNHDIHKCDRSHYMQKSDQIKNTEYHRSSQQKKDNQIQIFSKKGRHFTNTEKLISFTIIDEVFLRLKRLLKEKHQIAITFTSQILHAKITMMKRQLLTSKILHKKQFHAYNTNNCDHNYGLKKWKMSTKHNGSLYKLPPSKYNTPQTSRTSFNDNSNNKQCDSYYEQKMSILQLFLNYSSQKQYNHRIVNSFHLIMPSTRARSRSKPKRKNHPRVSNNARSSSKAKVKPKSTTPKTITPSKISKASMESIIHGKLPNPKDEIKAMDVKINRAQANLQALQDAEASEDDLHMAKLFLNDAIEEKEITIEAYQKQKDDEEVISFADFDEMFKKPPECSPTSSTDSSSKSSNTSTSSPRVIQVNQDEEEEHDNTVVENVEVITQVDLTSNDATSQTSESTSPRTNQSNVQKKDAITKSLPKILPQKSLLQTTIDDAVQVMPPQRKVQMMVQRARARAQSQAKLLEIQKSQQKDNQPNDSSKVNDEISSKSQSKSVKKKVDTPKTAKKSKKATKSDNRYAMLDSDAESDQDLDSEYEDDGSEASSTENASTSDSVSKSTAKSTRTSKQLTQTSLRANKRIHTTFLTLKLKVKKHRDPVKELFNKAKAWLKAVQMIDPTFILYEYRAKTPDVAIVSPKKIPSEIELFKKYFSGANPQITTGHAWCQIWAGHDEPITNLRASLQGWSADQDTYIYVKRLQHKDTVRDYFLLWSTPKMDPEALYNATVTAAKKYTNQELHFAYVWAVIRRNKGQYKTTESTKNKGEQYVKALHIEVPRESKDVTYSILGKLFSSTSVTRLLFRDLRMVPVLRKEMTSYVRSKVNHLISKQEKYLSTVSVSEVYELEDIDYVNSSLNLSMREMIMTLKTLRTFDKNNNSLQVFTSVDAITWPEPGYALTYPTYLEEEAQEYIASLPSFLIWCYGDHVMDMITPAAARQANAAPWDPEEMRAITPQSMELDAITAEADNLAPWVDTEAPSIHIPNINKVTENFLYSRATDADSISTFNTKKSNRSASEDEDDGTRTSKRAKKARQIMENNTSTSDSMNPTDSSSRKGGKGIVTDPPEHLGDSGACL